jgi:hypothetical protein
VDYFFFYGTLLDADVFSLVLGRGPSELFVDHLELKGFSCFKVQNEFFPVLRPDPKGVTCGKIYKIPDVLKKRLYFFEDVGFDFKVSSLGKKMKGQEIFYFSPTDQLKFKEELWSLEYFNKYRLDYVEMCSELMIKMG